MWVLFACVVVLCSGEGDRGAHVHALPHAWEWAGAFELSPSSSFVWMAEKAGAAGSAAYTDSTWLLAIVPTTGEGAEGIEAAEPRAVALFNGSATAAPGGSTLTPDQLFNLQMDEQTFLTQWKIAVPAPVGAAAEFTDYVIFSQHSPMEFEGASKGHYLKDALGSDVEPTATEPSAAAAAAAAAGATSEAGSLGDATIAAFATAMCSFTGVILISQKLDEWVEQSYASVFAR